MNSRKNIPIMIVFLLFVMVLSSCVTGDPTLTQPNDTNSSDTSRLPSSTNDNKGGTTSETPGTDVVTPAPTTGDVTPTPDPTDDSTPTPTPDVYVFDVSAGRDDSVTLRLDENGDGTYTAVISGEGRMKQYEDDTRPWGKYVNKITTLIVEDGVVNVGKRVMTKSSSLKEVIIKKGCKSIEMDAFAYCPALETIYIPDSIIEIEQGTVYGSSNIKNLYLGFTNAETFRAIYSVYDFNEDYEKAEWTLGLNYGDDPKPPTPTPTPADDEYDRFGDRYIISSLYENGFEVWPSQENDDYCPNAFFQNCIVIEPTELDMRGDLASYSAIYYYRAVGEKEFKGGFTAPSETCYKFIYRFQISECPEGDLAELLKIGVKYEIVIQFKKGSDVLGYTKYITEWTADYDNAHRIYKTFWSRHDRNKGYIAGAQELTFIDTFDPYGVKIDVTDGIDRSGMQLTVSENMGYASIIRVKTSSDILFSPELSELRQMIDSGKISSRSGAVIPEFNGRLVFTVKDFEGNDFYTYPAIILPIYNSKGAWFDFFLQGNISGEEIDCGLCPLSGRTYDVYFELLSADGSKALYCGSYNNITVDDSVSASKYYKYVPIPGEENIKFNINFAVRDGVGGKIKGESSFSISYGQMTGEVTAVADKGYSFVQWSDGITDATHPAVKADRNKTIYAIFIKESSGTNVADMYITTSTGSPITSKNYVKGTVKVVSKVEGFSFDAVSMQIRGRGNSSWNGGAWQSSYDSKNSYRLKLDEKMSLFGMDSNRDWVLGSNKFDLLGLRTWSMWKLAEYMGTIPYYSEGYFVNMYINGVYRGMYLVSELVEVGKGRVEVDDNVAGTNKGFLVELDFRGDYESGVIYGLDYFRIPQYATDIEFVIKSHIDSEKDTKAIQDYVELCHKAIMSGKRAEIDKYVDIPSLIDMFIIEEFSKDVDCGAASFYIQRNPGGKLYFTAPWDFDFGFGTYGPAVGWSSFVCETSSGRNTWYNKLISEKWFCSEVLARMKQLDPTIKKLYKDIRNKAEGMYSEADRNATFWDMYGNNFHVYVSGQVSSNLHSYAEHIDFILLWMEYRWEWMKNDLESR